MDRTEISSDKSFIVLEGRYGARAIRNCHNPWAGVTKVITCPCEAGKPFVRRISFKLDLCNPSSDGFASQQWRRVERDTLRAFPHLEQITVQTSASGPLLRTLYMVFQRKELMAQRTQNYKANGR